MTSHSDQSLFKGHSVLITGATGDIGTAIVSACLRAGAFVFANGRDEEKLAALEEKFPDNLHSLHYDVTDEKAVKEAFRQIQKQQMQPKVGPLFGLVNNAGIMEEAPLSVTRLDSLKAQLNTNLLAPYQHMQLASRLMSRQRKGSIVNILSMVGEQGASGMSAYASSKAALKGATLSLAKELAPIGIRVNGVAPGFIATSLTAHYDDEAQTEVKKRRAIKRAGNANEVARAVLFLLSEQASYTTGHILPVDGLFSP